MKKVYVITLVGESVYQNCTTICVINDLDAIPKVRENLQEKYGIEFSTVPAKQGMRLYHNITDDRDINLNIVSTDFIIA